MERTRKAVWKQMGDEDNMCPQKHPERRTARESEREKYGHELERTRGTVALYHYTKRSLPHIYICIYIYIYIYKYVNINIYICI